MRYEARVTAYDVMDEVWVTVTVQASSGFPDQGTHQVLATRTSLAGTGETDVHEWLRDVLVGALEML